MILSLLLSGVTGETASAQTARSAEILYQADTYTPPFYRGKALPSGENRISAVAYPDLTGTGLDPAKLHYKWMRDGLTLPEYTGTGKRFASFETSIASDETLLEVEIADPTGSYRAKKSVYIKDRAPKVLIYEDNATLGVLYNKIVPKEYALPGTEATFLGIPYFFSAENPRSPDIAYSWNIGGESTAQHLPSLTVRSQGGRGGSTIELQVEHKSRYAQSGSYGFNISFGNDR